VYSLFSLSNVRTFCVIFYHCRDGCYIKPCYETPFHNLLMTVLRRPLNLRLKSKVPKSPCFFNMSMCETLFHCALYLVVMNQTTPVNWYILDSLFFFFFFFFFLICTIQLPSTTLPNAYMSPTRRTTASGWYMWFHKLCSWLKPCCFTNWGCHL